MDEVIQDPHLWAGILLMMPVLLYAVMIVWVRRGWRNTAPLEVEGVPPAEKITLIVPCHNEAKHLPAFLESLGRQTWPADRMEVILVDDHSTDTTGEILAQYAAAHSHVRVLRSGRRGKKEALETALAVATTAFILATDADALLPPRWVETMMALRVWEGAAFVAGPVLPETGRSFSARFGYLESAALLGVATGSAARGHALFCSAASMGFEKRLVDLEEDVFRKEIPSGDDVFLLHAVKRHRPEDIRYLRSHNATVTVREEEGMGHLFRQRRRWAGKTYFYRDRDTLIVAALVLAANTALLAVLPLAFLTPWGVPMVVGLWGLKSFPDLLLLYDVLNFYEQRKLLRWFPVMQLLYPFYLLLTGTMTTFSLWRKERTWDGSSERNP